MLRILSYAGLVMFGLYDTAYAQKPKYQFTSYDGSGVAAARGFSQDNVGLKYQSIYYPTNFPAMPTGKVAAIYIRVGRNPLSVSTSVYSLFTAKIGPTNDSTFPNGVNKYDTFKTGLTTIYGPATFTVTGTDSIGKWVRIPVTTGNFSFSPEQKFVVEVAMGPKSNGTGFDIMATNKGTIHKNRTLGGHRDSLRSFNNTSIVMMDLGIDLATTDIPGVYNVASFGLFPNPTIDGRFQVSLTAERPLRDVSVSVTNMAGQLVWCDTYLKAGNEFFRQIYPGPLAKGTYLVRIEADGEALSRTLLVQ